MPAKLKECGEVWESETKWAKYDYWGEGEKEKETIHVIRSEKEGGSGEDKE